MTSPGTFQTFCVEDSEYFSPGSTYNVQLNTAAVYGMPGATSGSEPVTLGTAWLYSQFANGSLSGYDYYLTNLILQTCNRTSSLPFFW